MIVMVLLLLTHVTYFTVLNGDVMVRLLGTYGCPDCVMVYDA